MDNANTYVCVCVRICVCVHACTRVIRGQSPLSGSEQLGTGPYWVSLPQPRRSWTPPRTIGTWVLRCPIATASDGSPVVSTFVPSLPTRELRLKEVIGPGPRLPSEWQSQNMNPGQSQHSLYLLGQVKRSLRNIGEGCQVDCLGLWGRELSGVWGIHASQTHKPPTQWGAEEAWAWLQSLARPGV